MILLKGMTSIWDQWNPNVNCPVISFFVIIFELQCLLVAKMTVQIRAMQKYMEDFPRNKQVKVQLKEMIDKRKKFLKYLRRWDYKRFEWILEKLDLVYKPPPT